MSTDRPTKTQKRDEAEVQFKGSQKTSKRKTFETNFFRSNP